MGICSRTQKYAQELIRHVRIIRLDELGKKIFMEELENLVQESVGLLRGGVNQ
jgi:hypothetical protein